jgi:hypothetical protein
MHIEEQGIDMQKMLDPKGRWPKARGNPAGRTNFGLDLLEVAKLATTLDQSLRPNMSAVVNRLRPLAEQINTEEKKQIHE